MMAKVLLTFFSTVSAPVQYLPLINFTVFSLISDDTGLYFAPHHCRIFRSILFFIFLYYLLSSQFRFEIYLMSSTPTVVEESQV